MTHSEITIPLSASHGLPGWILRTGTHSGGMLFGVGVSLMAGSKHFEAWRAAAELACGYVPVVEFDGQIHTWAEEDYMTDAFSDGEFTPPVGHPFHGIDPAQVEAWIDSMAENGTIPSPFATLLSQIPIEQRFGENSISFSETKSEILHEPLIQNPAFFGAQAANLLLGASSPYATSYAYVDGRWLTEVYQEGTQPSFLVPLSLALACLRLPGLHGKSISELLLGLSELDLSDLDVFRTQVPAERVFEGSAAAFSFFDARALSQSTPPSTVPSATPRI